jgi:hypothetical protein
MVLSHIWYRLSYDSYGPGQPNLWRNIVSEFQISAVAFKEGDAWVVQGIEHDIVAHAYDLTKLPQAFMQAVVENVCITKHLGRKPLEGIRAAPARYREMFEMADMEVRPIKPIDGPDVSMRVFEATA